MLTTTTFVDNLYRCQKKFVYLINSIEILDYNTNVLRQMNCDNLKNSIFFQQKKLDYI